MSTAPPTTKRSRLKRKEIVAIVAAVIVAIGTIIGGLIGGDVVSVSFRDPNAPTPTASASQPPPVVASQAPGSQMPVSQAPVTQAPPPQTTTQAPKALSWKINPKNHPVKRCTAFAGTGTVPDGRYFWIVVRSNPEDDRKYYFQDASKDKPSPGHWRAEKVTVGGPSPDEWKHHIKYQIIAVTVTPALNDRINARDFDGGTPSLPNGADPKTHITVTAGKDRRECKWN